VEPIWNHKINGNPSGELIRWWACESHVDTIKKYIRKQHGYGNYRVNFELMGFEVKIKEGLEQ